MRLAIARIGHGGPVAAHSRRCVMIACTATRPSEALPGHVHTCASEHAAGDHVCADPTCRRWFGVKAVAS